MRAFLCICLLAACAPSETSTQDDGHGTLTPPRDGQETQGRDLLGSTVDAYGSDPTYHVSATTHGVDADGNAVEVVFHGNASLASGDHVGIDPWFDGVVLTTQEGGELELHPARGGTDVAFYTLRYRATPADAWADPCGGGDAVPLAGRWRRDGLHEADAAHTSFACTGAVAWKCIEWGYLAGADPTALRWRAHQACTRMARADYCANGHSHTREGTKITIYDRVGVTMPPPLTFPGVDVWPPPPNQFFFEAAWNDIDKPASCIGRVRWQSLPLGGVCGASTTLGDPRVDTTLRFCDDIMFGTNDVPLLVNTSRFDDLELHVWSMGDDAASTVRGYYDESGTTPDRAPFPLDGTYTHFARDGMLLRVIPEGADPASFEPVHLYVKGNDHTLGPASSPPAGWTDRGWEGFVSKVQIAPEIPFNVYRNMTTGDVIATSIAPPPGSAYVLTGTLGYVMPPEE